MGWRFSASIVQRGESSSPSLVCYRRGVYNDSNGTILNIRWDVAAFRRRMIASRQEHASCSMLPGLVSESPASGPLHYGISSDAFDTTVLPPREGWEQRAAQSEPQADEFPPIRSTFEFGLNTERAEATLTVHSYVTVANSRRRLVYEVENRGPAAVLFILNLPATSAMEAKLPFLQKPTLLESDSRRFFEADVEGRLTAQPATIIISDEKDPKMGLAADTVGVYAPVGGKRPFSDRLLLQSVQ